MPACGGAGPRSLPPMPEPLRRLVLVLGDQLDPAAACFDARHLNAFVIEERMK